MSAIYASPVGLMQQIRIGCQESVFESVSLLADKWVFLYCLVFLPLPLYCRDEENFLWQTRTWGAIVTPNFLVYFGPEIRHSKDFNCQQNLIPNWMWSSTQMNWNMQFRFQEDFMLVK
jgi:hypothetical protein